MSLERLEQEHILEQEQARMEQRNRAADLLYQAWEEALMEGIDPDILAEAALHSALMDMVQAHSEQHVTDMISKLPERIERGDFTPKLILH